MVLLFLPVRGGLLLLPVAARRVWPQLRRAFRGPAGSRGQIRALFYRP